MLGKRVNTRIKHRKGKTCGNLLSQCLWVAFLNLSTILHLHTVGEIAERELNGEVRLCHSTSNEFSQVSNLIGRPRV